jgi:DNA helicase-2/ATP-dependent DNA helicase PcrA
MIPTRGKAAPVQIVHAKSRTYQYLYLVETAKRCERETAILFRNNDTALPLIDLFERNNIPYNCRSFEDTFFSNRVVTDVLDILRFSYDPRNEALFLRLYYKFGAAIPKKSALWAIERSRASGKPLFEELMHAPEIRGAVQDAVLDLTQNLPQLQTDSAETAVHRVWEAMHYGRFVEQRKLDKGKRRVTIHLPYDKTGLLDELYREGKVESVDYAATVDVVAVCPPRLLGRMQDYIEDWRPPKEDWE